MNGILYSKEHTWITVEGTTGTIGISEFAQKELGEIVYVDLPNVGDDFEKDEVFGSVEALKTVSDLFMPVSGEITAINEGLNDNPIIVNENPLDKGWMVRIEISDMAELEGLLDADGYKQLVTADEA